MSNIKSITIRDHHGHENIGGCYVDVEVFTNVDLTVKEQNKIFDTILPLMRQTCQLHYCIPIYKDDERVGDDDSFRLAKRLGRTQEIRDLVDKWL